MERRVCLSLSKKKLEMALALGFADYKARYDKDCEARGFEFRFADKFGYGVFAWYDPSGTGLENWTPAFEWVDSKGDDDLKMYGVYDSVFNEFLESFSTQKEAEEYCENARSRYSDGSKGMKVVRFLNADDIMDTSHESLKYY